jgi:hypothetical protein
MEESEKDILRSLLENYEELQRIIRKTEYEVYVGELKSKLEDLNYLKIIYQTLDIYPFTPILTLLSFLPIPLFGSFHNLDHKISCLQDEISNAEKEIAIKYEILDRFFHFLKFCVDENEIMNIKKEAEAINTEIQKNIEDTLESSLQYKLKVLERKLSKGRIYLAQMKDSQRKYNSIKKNLYSISGERINLKASDYEILYDKTSKAIYEADLAIEDSKWLRRITYFSLLIAIIGILLTLLSIFSSSLFKVGSL